MAGRRTNLALLVVLGLALITGGLSFATGSGWIRWVALAHAVVGLAVVVLSPWKSVVVRRGLKRGRGGRGAALIFLVLLGVCIVAGVLHSLGFPDWGPVTAMQVHVGAALGCVPLLVWHVVTRPVRVTRTDVSRRALLRAGAILSVSGLAYLGGETVARVASLPGARRRVTGSHERGSFEPGAMPVTQWLDDSVQNIDVDSWRLRIGGREVDYGHLLEFEDEIRATVDCTGGWYAVQDWTGARLDRLVGDLDGRSIVVGSATGYARRFPIEDAGRMLLATRVGGRPLSAGHGRPARIVAPNRRGFWWVKWVTSIDVDDRPWWTQSPFPLT